MAKSIHFLNLDITKSQDLSSAALSYTTAINREFKLEEVAIHFSVAITETVTLTRDSKNGSNYDHVIAKQVLVGATDYVFRPTGECNFKNGDELKVECTKANNTGIAYVVIKTSEM